MPALAGTGASMDPMEQLHQEVSCPICLQYFWDPMIIDCGHNFCHSCITRTWGGLTMGPCPQCRVVSQAAAPRLNRVLASVVELVKQLRLNQKKRPTPQNCPAHEEALNIYCMEDQRALCVLCTMSFAHFSHCMLPLEQAIKEGKVPQSQASTENDLLRPSKVLCNSCLVTVTDPITPNCGHSVCRVCVARSWVCPTCKPKPKARLPAPAVMLTCVTELNGITSAESDLNEPEPLLEVHFSSLRSLMQHCEITEQHLPKCHADGHLRKSTEEFKNPWFRSHSFMASKSDPRTSLQKLKDRMCCESQKQKRLDQSRLVETGYTEEEKILEKTHICSNLKSLRMFEDVKHLLKRADAGQQNAAIVAKEEIFYDGKCVSCGAVQQAQCTPLLEDNPFLLSTQRDKTFWKRQSSQGFEHL